MNYPTNLLKRMSDSSRNWIKSSLLLFFCSLIFSNVYSQDNIPPVAVCQNFNTTLDFSGTKFISPQNINGGSFDPDGNIVSYSLSQSQFTCDDIGANAVTLIVVDDDGAVDSCQAIVTVSFPQQSLACFSTYTASLDIGGNVIISPQDILASPVFDPCDLFAVTPSTFDCSNIGSNFVSIEDGQGNSCFSEVFIVDNIDPVAICFSDVNVALDQFGNVDLLPEFIDAGSFDNCGNVTLSVSPSSFNCSNIGESIVVFLTAEDQSGNTNQCWTNVNIEDKTPPQVVCIDQINVSLDSSGMAYLTPADIDAGSYDNCGELTMTISQSTFDCSNIQTTNTVILTVTDASGNSNQCFTNVIIEDKMPPIVTCPADITLDCFLGDNLDPSITGEPQVVDNCDLIGYSWEDQIFDLGNSNYKVIRTWVVIDWYSGGVDTCVQSIQVLDMTPPVMVCLSQLTASLDVSGNLVLFPGDLDNGSFDACDSTLSFSVFPNQFGCSSIGDTTVVLVGTDGSGNQSTCEVNLTIQDKTPPQVVCIDQINLSLDSSGMAYLTPADIDAGSYDNCGEMTMTISQSTFDCSNIQTTNTVILTVTDASGNSNQCFTNVIIEDKTPPIVTCPADITLDCFLGDNLDPSITGEPQVVDNCDLIGYSWEDQIFDLGNSNFKVIRTWIVVDWYSLSFDTCLQVIDLLDLSSPILACVADTTLELGADGSLSITPDGFISGNVEDCSDVSLSLDKTDFSCADLGANIVTLTATDENGNFSFCQFIINIIGVDTDGDGFTICSGDCDDQDGAISPGAEEICGDNIDNNCNNEVDESCGCSSESGSTQFEWIDEISLNGQSNPSGNDNGYGDYTVITLPVVIGDNDIVLTPGFAGAAYNEFWSIWIDLNQNGQYETDEEVYSNNSTSTITDVISIPTTALLGTTSMRVSMQYNQPADPCEDFSEGEVEDYTVNITEPTYCDSQGQSTQYEWIKKVRLKSINNLSGNDNGYADFTNLSTNLNPGQSKNIILKPGFSGSSYLEYWRVWVDWNDDGDFDDNGELEVEVATTGNTTQQITVPNNASGGDKMMRVSMKYGGYAGPCEVFAEGEVEDYTIFITGNNPALIQDENDIVSTESIATSGESFLEKKVSARNERVIFDVRLFPNPASSVINIEMNSSIKGKSTLIMYNEIGQLVFEKVIERDTYTIDINDSKFTNGIYALIIKRGDRVETKKVIITK